MGRCSCRRRPSRSWGRAACRRWVRTGCGTWGRRWGCTRWARAVPVVADARTFAHQPAVAAQRVHRPVRRCRGGRRHRVSPPSRDPDRCRGHRQDEAGAPGGGGGRSPGSRTGSGWSSWPRCAIRPRSRPWCVGTLDVRQTRGPDGRGVDRRARSRARPPGRAGQLRARPRCGRRAGPGGGPGLPGRVGAGDQPGGDRRGRGAVVAGAAVGACPNRPARLAGVPHPRRWSCSPPGRPTRPARRGRGEPARGGGDLSASGRDPAGHRVGGGPGPGHDPGGDRRAGSTRGSGCCGAGGAARRSDTRPCAGPSTGATISSTTRPGLSFDGVRCSREASTRPPPRPWCAGEGVDREDVLDVLAELVSQVTRHGRARSGP